MIPVILSMGRKLTNPAWPNLEESATSQVSSARSLISEATWAPSTKRVVSPRSGEKPSVPRKAIRVLKSAIERSAVGPTNDSDSRRKTPPVRMTLRAGLARAVLNTSAELVTICTPRRAVR